MVKLSIQSSQGICYFNCAAYNRTLEMVQGDGRQLYISFPVESGAEELDVSELKTSASKLGGHFHDCDHYKAEGELALTQDIDPWADLLERIEATPRCRGILCVPANGRAVRQPATYSVTTSSRYKSGYGILQCTYVKEASVKCELTVDTKLAWLYLTTDASTIEGIPAKSIGRESVCLQSILDATEYFPAWTGLAPDHYRHVVSTSVYTLSELRNRLYEFVDPVYGHRWTVVDDTSSDLSALAAQVRETVIQRLKRHCGLVEQQLDEDGVSFSRLTYRAADSVRLLNINSISFISEGISFVKDGGFRPMLEEARDLDRTLKSGRKRTQKLAKTLKTSASIYLGNHYGTRLSAMDSVEIASALHRCNEMLYDRQTMSAVDSSEYFLDGSNTHYTAERRVKATISSLSDQDRSLVVATDNLVRRAYEADILPTWSNIWDLVPYSFVVDWFIPIGNHLEDVETGHYLATLHPYEVFESTKIVGTTAFDYFLSGARVSGTLTTKMYVRRCSDTFNTETPVVEDAGGFNMKHGIESSALIISRLG